MYPAELQIKDTTESNTSASYVDLLLSIGDGGWTVSCTLPFMPNVTISSSIPQIFLSWVAIFHLRQPMVCLSHSSYGMPGLAPLIKVLLWERRDFHVSFLGWDMSGNVLNRPSGSSMVDMGISSNIIKSSAPKWNMIFWDMIIFTDTLHWSDISLNRDLVTELDLINVFDGITLFREVSIGHLQRVRLVNRRRLLLRTPAPVPFGTCICSNVRLFFLKLVVSPDLFKFRTSLGTLFLDI